jgi:hypothetical protein
VFDKDWNVIADPAVVQGPVFLLDNVFDVFPRHGGLLFREPVHDMLKTTHFFDDSHSESFGLDGGTLRLDFFSPRGYAGHLPITLRTSAGNP